MGPAGQCSTMHALRTPSPSAGCPQIQFHPAKITNQCKCLTAQHSTAHRSMFASGIVRAYALLAWGQFIGSANVGRVPTERKLTRVPAPRVVPREPNSLLQAKIKTDHRSQVTERGKGTFWETKSVQSVSQGFICEINSKNLKESLTHIGRMHMVRPV